VSSYLHDHAQPGVVLELRAPAGDVVVLPAHTPPLCRLAWLAALFAEAAMAREAGHSGAGSCRGAEIATGRLNWRPLS
jgi:hypothetical protein